MHLQLLKNSQGMKSYINIFLTKHIYKIKLKYSVQRLKYAIVSVVVSLFEKIIYKIQIDFR
ncbi:hypothetical protein SDC9_112678 [bioreactor metagenome]|uniref:Uncharacterized protein n=1 Tax=bioreactor metagenome TaxID=1076179 RepID=A0A645BKJ2_9ZZZZ